MINSIKITPNSKIPQGFTLNRVYFQKNSLKRERGNLSAIYSKDNHEKRVYFKYDIDAKVKVLVANTALRRGTILEKDFFDEKFIKFTNFYDLPVLNIQGVELKTSIPIGKILTQRMIRKVPDIHRGDIITAEVRDGGVQLFITVVALQDGIKGEIIRVKRESGRKILNATVISNDKVLIK